jgi:choline dehydrogenase-like flavoprotein
MGGTRYSADKAKSVLNQDLSLIGVPNLHVLGSSVFPTGGVENPTHSILCLALYLAKALKTNIL